MRKLLIVRHGQTDANAQGRTIATSDPSLNARGEAQASHVGRLLRQEAIDLVISSPRRRCVETAERIRGEQVEIPELRIDERLVELGMGEIEALSVAEIEERGLADVFARWRQGTPPAYPNGAETFEAGAVRATELFDELLTSSAQTIAIVGHSHALRILIATCILGGDAASHRRIFLDHATVTSVFWESSSPRLAQLNSV